MNRAIFLVDGFNLYHSVVDAEKDNGGRCVKWLDLRRLCLSYLHIIGTSVKDRMTLRAIHYFSATPTHRSAAKQARHGLYMECLALSGIQVHLGRFKQKRAHCSLCNKDYIGYEEKESDVALAAKLFAVCHLRQADSIVVVSGDTDLAPAVRTCKELFREMFICFAFPYRRTHEELQHLAPGSFKISHRSYLRNQYPDPLCLPDGRKIAKPPEWA